MTPRDEGECWRAIPGTDGQYSVSDRGRVRSEPLPGRSGRQRGRVLTPRKGRKGYLLFRVCLTSGMQWHSTVHAAVAAAFIGSRPEGVQIDHKDGDKANNRVENLEYVTCRENIRRSWEAGQHTADHCRGELNEKAKLTEDEVKAIRAIHPAKSLKELAEMYGVSVQNIALVVKRKTWKHVA